MHREEVITFHVCSGWTLHWGYTAYQYMSEFRLGYIYTPLIHVCSELDFLDIGSYTR